MKISELPEPYRSLARLRETQLKYNGLNEGFDHLGGAFIWSSTPEGLNFWYEVYKGKHPAIPEISLAELENL